MSIVPPATSSGPSDLDSAPTLRTVLQRGLRHWRVLLVAAAVAVVAFRAVPWLLPPMYQSEAVLLYRQVIQTESLLGSEGFSSESRRSRNARLQELLLARSNLQSIIEREGLYRDVIARDGLPEAVDEMRRRIRCRVGEGDTVSIQFDDETAAIAQKVTHLLAQSVVQESKTYETESARSTRVFLATQQAQVAEQLRVKEQALAQFLVAHPEFAMDTVSTPTAGASVRAAARAETASESGPDPAAALRRQADRLRRQLQLADNPYASPATTQPAPAPELTPESQQAVTDAQREVQRAREELTARKAQYTPLHPDVIAAQAKLAAAEDRLAKVRASTQTITPPPPAATTTAAPGDSPAELARQLRYAEAASASAASRAAPTATSDPWKSGSTTIIQLETLWVSLNRDVDEARERYAAIQRRLFQAAILATAESGDDGSQVRVIDEAYLPTRPYQRGRYRTGALGAAGTLLLGCLAALGFGALDDRVYDTRDLARLRLGPVALVMPRRSDGRGSRRV